MPIADRVYGVLLEQFMDGTRAPGETINIATVSKELDVSQTPIREALARLEHTGLVRREALKGYQVAPLLTEDELISLRDARSVLEPALTLEAARRVNEKFLEELLGTIDILDDASKLSHDLHTFPRYWSADERFHSAIAKQSGNPFLAMAFSALGGQVQRFRLFAELGASDAAYAAKEHRQIFEALRRREPEEASALMKDHVRSAGNRALGDLHQVGGTPSDEPG